MKGKLLAISLVVGLLLVAVSPTAVASPSNPRTYTLDADFDEGTLVNLNHSPNHDQLQLDSIPTPFHFIWVAASGRGTIVKIDTDTGTILGEYWSAPQDRPKNPSRTTVDGYGNVWAGNRDEATGGRGSVVHIGLKENVQCVDRNNNGVIDTSTALGDIKPWTNAGGADTNGGVSTAQDECIIHYVRTAGTNVRTVAVDANNNVWIGGLGNRVHQLHDGITGAPINSEFSYGRGGYGGLVDANGVLWSAGSWGLGLLRYVPATGAWSVIGTPMSYGLARDSSGNIWNTQWTYNIVHKISPAGSVLAVYGTYGSAARGIAATADDNMWIANSGSNSVTRLSNTGALQATIPVGNHPTGVAVDAAGKVWVTNYNSHNVMRIDPATDNVDLTVSLGSGASPYNYSDMTGSTLIAPPNTGTWTVVHDSGIVGAKWQTVSWNSLEPGDSSISVKVASSTDGMTFGPEVSVTNGGTPSVADGQYLKIIVSFVRSTTTDADGDGVMDSPVLYDLTVLANRPPDCSEASPSLDTLWPPDHRFKAIDVLGVTDPEGDAIVITIDSIFQDEPLDTYGDGSFTPDGLGVGTSTAEVRAERAGTKMVPDNGRVYHIFFTADDGHGGSCTGEVLVGVPHDVKDTPVDDGALYDSTALAP